MATKNEVAQFEFKKKQNERLIKGEQDLNGASFSIADLKDCSVFLLGFTQQVQVDDCDGCRIFVGPCDGSVFIRDCTDCIVSVAARQLRLRDCRNVKMGVYCSTRPALESSTSISFAPWMGAYPGLTRHFNAANLDPANNSWDKVYDYTPVNEGEVPNWTVQFDSNTSMPQWWEVDVVEGTPDNPVPLPNGQLYQYHDPKDDEIILPPTPDFQLRNPIFDTLSDSPQSQASTRGNPLFLGTQAASPQQSLIEPARQNEIGLETVPLVLENTSHTLPSTSEVLTPIAAWRRKNQARLEAKQQDEICAKAKIQEAALEFRTAFYQNWMQLIEQKKAVNRGEDDLFAAARAKQTPNSNPWEGILDLIDFDHSTHTIDLSRFKCLLFAAKSRAIPGQQ